MEEADSCDEDRSPDLKAGRDVLINSVQALLDHTALGEEDRGVIDGALSLWAEGIVPDIHAAVMRRNKST